MLQSLPEDVIVRRIKKIALFPVTRPYLFYGTDPPTFYEIDKKKDINRRSSLEMGAAILVSMTTHDEGDFASRPVICSPAASALVLTNQMPGHKLI